MTEQEILTLLVYLNELDGRHSPNEIKVKAWADVLNDSASDMDLQFARTTAKKHYALLEEMLTPAVLVRAWRLHRAAKKHGEPVPDSHCRKHSCQCSHRVCYRGWIDSDDGKTWPCGVCRESLARVLSEIPPAGFRTEADWARVRFRDSLGDR